MEAGYLKIISLQSYNLEKKSENLYFREPTNTWLFFLDNYFSDHSIVKLDFVNNCYVTS